jgi:small GTP-binding protein
VEKLMSVDFSFKILLLGDASVGKTSLTHRYITGVFVDSPRLTIGVDFFSKKVRLENGKRVKLQIWDFGGEERFRFLLPTYSKGSNAALFLYDITSPKTLNSLPDWLEVVRANAGDIPIILVGSKLDLAEHRQVTMEQVQEMFKKNALTETIELSSKTGENVEESFKLISKLLLQYSQILAKQPQPVQPTGEGDVDLEQMPVFPPTGPTKKPDFPSP